jgi:hypothetical protein
MPARFVFRMLMMTRRIFLALGAAMMLAACASPGGARGPQQTISEFTGTSAERIDLVTKILGGPAALPSTPLDANGLEVKIGDGVLGPSDYVRFMMLRIDAADVQRWKDSSKALIQKPQYSEPSTRPNWWVSQLDYEKLTFRGISTFTEVADGWMGVHDDGRVFIVVITR